MTFARRTALILVGFGVGLATALYLAWMVWPVEYAESAPADLEPLITGLERKGFCFATLRDHPQYKAWFAAHPPAR